MGSRVLVGCVGAAVLFAGAAGVAGAIPPPPPPPPCSFTLSAPVPSGDLVTATVQSTGCAALAAPYSTVACLQAPGAPIRCVQGHGTDPARVSVPYAPGQFIASGRGCAGWVGLPPAPDCQNLGPTAAAL